MYPVAALFGLGFDTATTLALLVVGASLPDIGLELPHVRRTCKAASADVDAQGFPWLCSLHSTYKRFLFKNLHHAFA
ncbi:hypothetical protein JAO82_00910 [Pontibaca sp. S1109L]|uniref:Uncharacterized protein n=1 Tax=Pontibaca salina TaxID=2795731 RepID=A0A934HHT9_9RHOB|nr:hypothetical protein [Pontibaca salina]